MKRGPLFALAVVAALALTPAVAAQTRLSGGGSFTDAPVVTPGSYTDTIRLREELFYAIELQEGQSLRVRATILGQKGRIPPGEIPSTNIELSFYDTRRERDPFSADVGIFDGRKSVSVAEATPEVGTGVDDVHYDGAGTYYASLRFFEVVGSDTLDQIRRSEFKLRLTFSVQGEVVSPAPTAEPAPTEPGDEGGALPPNPPGQSSSSLVRVSSISFLVGLVAGFAVVVGRRLLTRSL